MINPIVKTIELADGRTITLETGKLEKQAEGSVMHRMVNHKVPAIGWDGKVGDHGRGVCR